MRISDWSSDVCSSDLTTAPPRSGCTKTLPDWEDARKPRFQGFPSSSSAHATIPLQDQLALMEQLAHRARHPGFALDPLAVEILGVLLRPVIAIHRLAERLRVRFPVALLFTIAMPDRLRLPGT